MSQNIKVGIRVRPLIRREKRQNKRRQWAVLDNVIYQINPASGKKNGDSHSFDYIFDMKDRNQDIYDILVQPVVNATLDGFNGTVIAYGQTSSGKTYTMSGGKHELGIIPLAIDNIFSEIRLSLNNEYVVRVSYIEIYNERIYDLINNRSPVRIQEDHSGQVILNVKKVVITSSKQAEDVLRNGEKVRSVAETMKNGESSRSHTVFQISLESWEEDGNEGITRHGQLNLVDLAGAERRKETQSTDLTMREGVFINKSLSTLGLVMKQLSEKREFVNYRDSKLTRLLQNSLGGNAFTAVICSVTPVEVEETKSTLKFASRAKFVKTKPYFNEIVTNRSLKSEYIAELEKLKANYAEKFKNLQKANEVEQVALKEQLEKIKRLEALVEQATITFQIPNIPASHAIQHECKHDIEALTNPESDETTKILQLPDVDRQPDKNSNSETGSAVQISEAVIDNNILEDSRSSIIEDVTDQDILSFMKIIKESLNNLSDNLKSGIFNREIFLDAVNNVKLIRAQIDTATSAEIEDVFETMFTLLETCIFLFNYEEANSNIERRNECSVQIQNKTSVTDQCVQTESVTGKLQDLSLSGHFKLSCENLSFHEKSKVIEININSTLIDEDKENYSPIALRMEKSLKEAKYELKEIQNKDRRSYKRQLRDQIFDSHRNIDSDADVSIQSCIEATEAFE